MSKKLKAVLIAALLLVGGVSVACFGLSACGGGGGGSNKDSDSTSTDPEKATLLGLDNDHDGIRDDIKAWIDQTVPDSARKRAALYQTARTLNETLAAGEANDKNLANQYKIDESKGLECLWSIFPDNLDGLHAANKLDDELTAEFLNTDTRMKAYLQYNQLLTAGGGGPSGADACDVDPLTLPN